MKQKKFNKKLSLNKKTIANLNNGEKRHVYGGKETVANKCLDSNYCIVFDSNETCTCDTCTCDATCPASCETCPSACSLGGACC